jgi:hypothetical protein
MKRSSALKRTAFKPARSELRRYTRMKPISDKRKEKNVEYAKAKRQMRKRSKGLCEARLPGCTIAATDPHHMMRRSAGGEDVASNLLHVCRTCHRYIHEHPAEAIDLGFLKSRYRESLL